MYAIFWKISIKCTHYVRREGGKTRDPGLEISTPTVDWNLHKLSLRMWTYFMGEKFEKLENVRYFLLTLFDLWCFRAFVLEARRLPSKTWEKNARAHLRVCQ